jgi:hypothetical protein
MRARLISVAAAAAFATTLVACTDNLSTSPTAGPSVLLASGSGGGGGSSTGGGGGGGSTRPCALLTFAILNDVATGTVVPSFWLPNMGYQAIASGTTEKSCDAIGTATIVFEDITGPSDGCEVTIAPWVNNPAYLNPKYGNKPMSRYQETFIYYTGASCLGRSRVLKATLTDPSVGGKVTSVTLNWTP